MAEDWRKKYLDLIDEQETQSVQWEKMDAALCHGLSRISLFAGGLSSDLDECLDQMRILIRAKGQAPALMDILEKISDRLSYFEASEASKLATPSQVLMYLLQTMPWPRSEKKDVKALQASLDRQPYAEELPAFLEEFTNLCLVSFNQGENKTARSTGGVLDKLFSKSIRKPSDGVSSEVLAHQLMNNITQVFRERELKNDFLEALSICENSDDYLDLSLRMVNRVEDLLAQSVISAVDNSSYLPTANELFIALLDRMSLPDELEDQAVLLKEKLAAPLTKEQWPSLMDKICDLIASIRRKAQQEKQDIERFLSNLTDSLKELDDRVKGASYDHATQHQSGQTLNTAVQAEMSGLVSSVEQAGDLDSLKQAVQYRLEQIRSHMVSYQVEEEERFRNASERMRILNERLRHLEQESDTLKKRVREQRNLALRDTLTGINNRLAYDERVEIEFNRWKRFRTPVSLMVWDVDKFKVINDTFGHQAGDKVLIAIAALLSSQIRESDFLARYGGEEFVLIAPGANCAEALKLAEKLRANVESSQFKHANTPVPVTVSCGLVEFKDGYTVEQLFDAADKALLQAKRQGRNLCLCAELGDL